MDPIERKITSIVKGINGANPAKLRAMNEANRAGASSSSSATVNANPTQQINAQNQALQKQAETIVPLNEQWNKYNETMRQVQKDALGYIGEMRSLNDVVEEYNKHTDTMKVNTKELHSAQAELFKGNTKQLYEFIKALELEDVAFEKTAKTFGMSSEELQKQLHNLEFSLQEDAEYVDNLKTSLGGLDASSAKAATGVSKLGGALKAIGKTVGWTAVITIAVGLLMKLLDALGLSVDKI